MLRYVALACVSVLLGSLTCVVCAVAFLRYSEFRQHLVMLAFKLSVTAGALGVLFLILDLLV